MRSTIVETESGPRLRVESRSLYTFGSCLAGMRPVASIRSEPDDGPAPRVEVGLPEVDWEWAIDPRRPTPEPVPRRTLAALEAITQPTNANLRLTLGDREAARIPVTLLPAAEWPHARDSRVPVAAHVVPTADPVFRTVVETTIPNGDIARTLPEVVRSSERDAVLPVTRALYEHLANVCEIEYEEPAITHDSWGEATHQTIRAAHEVAGAKASRAGKGTCLDLALFLAACLESLGLNPIVFFCGDVNEPPTHAFVGCWLEPGRRFRPLLTDVDSLRARLAGGELIVCEATGVCRGEHALPFEDACRRAEARFHETARIHAVDVAATRPPHGSVRPLRLAHAPVVQQALWEAERFRERLEARARETLHVLYGLCVAKAHLTTRLLQSAGGAAEGVRKIIDASLPPEGHNGPGEETTNYRVCLETARLNAGNRGELTVEEVDLLWAVLDSPSRNVRKVLEAAGCDCSVLSAALARECRRPREMTVSRAFDPAEISGH